MNAAAGLNADVVREVARGRWPAIFAALCIEVGSGEHRPCPCCGGTDRFRFDDQGGSGSWFCNQDSPKAGDGLALVMNVRGCGFPQALRLVADILGLSPSSPVPRRRRARPPARVNRVKLAFRFDLAALDLTLRATRIIDAGRQLNIAVLDDTELDHALGFVVRAHADVERAEIFAHVADTLRLRAFTERTSRERSHCAA